MCATRMGTSFACAAISPDSSLANARNGELFRWRLDNGVRVTQTMTLMAQGLY